MQLNQTFNEAPQSEASSVTAGNFNVRAYYTETDAGHVFGVFKSRERAEQCLLVLAARSGVVHAVVEEV